MAAKIHKLVVNLSNSSPDYVVVYCFVGNERVEISVPRGNVEVDMGKLQEHDTRMYLYITRAEYEDRIGGTLKSF